jgi:hypothetical protein
MRLEFFEKKRLNHQVEFEVPDRENSYVRAKTRNGKLAKYSEVMFYFEQSNGSIEVDENDLVKAVIGIEVEVNGEYVKIPEEARRVRIDHNDRMGLQARTRYTFE